MTPSSLLPPPLLFLLLSITAASSSPSTLWSSWHHVSSKRYDGCAFAGYNPTPPKRNDDGGNGGAVTTERNKNKDRNDNDDSSEVSNNNNISNYSTNEWASARTIGSFLLQRSREAEEEEQMRIQRGMVMPANETDGEVEIEQQPRQRKQRKQGEKRVRDRGGRSSSERGRGRGGGADKPITKVEIIDATQERDLSLKSNGEKKEGETNRYFDSKSQSDAKVAIGTDPNSGSDADPRGGEAIRSRKKQYVDIEEDQAQELDQAVTILPSTTSLLTKDIKTLPSTSSASYMPSRVLSSLPKTLTTTTTESDGAPSQRSNPLRNLFARRAKKKVDEIATANTLMNNNTNRLNPRSKTPLPLSNPQHTHRIDKDIQRLAVSIASSIDSTSQWKTFCDDGGGLLPLLQCIRDGAREIRRTREQDRSMDGRNAQNNSDEDEDDEEEEEGVLVRRWLKKEEAITAACSACKTLRDLCAISKPFAAVVTDGILRADAAWFISDSASSSSSGGLICDLVTLLKYGKTSAADSGSAIFLHRNRRRKKKREMERFRELRARGVDVRRLGSRKKRREARRRCSLYVVQLLLEMAFASDAAVNSLRSTPGLTDAVLSWSSYAPTERLRRRWVRYPVEIAKRMVSSFSSSATTTAETTTSTTTTTTTATNVSSNNRKAFSAATSIPQGLTGQIQESANQVLAAVGYNIWYPKIPGQKGLRILCLDGGGTRGITAISTMRAIVDAMGGLEVCDAFDMVVGTSTGAIIAFLVGLRRESSQMARKRYDRLIKRIFVKSALSTPMLVFTTATYDEAPFKAVMEEILGDNSMLSSRADPRVPLVFAVSSKMSSTPTQLCLFRNYNYSGGEKKDAFVVDPEEARIKLGLDPEDDIMTSISDWEGGDVSRGSCPPRTGEASRHPGSFRVLQRAAMRATTAAPTVFKPVLMGGELYCDGGIVASNPAAVAIHEARSIFPDIPIEMVVSCGTGAFIEEKSAPRIGWDGIIGQIVNSATDGEQTHHVLEDILGQGGTAKLGKSSVSKTRYYRFNPVIGTSETFPIDGTDPDKLEELSKITMNYMQEPEQASKLQEISEILEGKRRWRKVLSWLGA